MSMGLKIGDMFETSRYSQEGYEEDFTLAHGYHPPTWDFRGHIRGKYIDISSIEELLDNSDDVFPLSEEYQKSIEKMRVKAWYLTILGAASCIAAIFLLLMLF